MSNRESGAFDTSGLQTAKVNEATHLGAEQATNTFDANLQHALRLKNLSAARSIVADAEAVLAAHDLTKAVEARSASMSKSHLAGAKARIAMSAGDPTAARAILVQAIERWPDVQPLRAMMTEVMLATGRARDVRPVLTHLGRPSPSRSTAQEGGSEKKDSTG